MSETNGFLNRLSDLQRGLLVAALGFIFCLVLFSLAEAAVRVRHWVKFGGLWGIEKTYQEDAASGLRVPIADSSFGPIEISSLGFRSPEISIAKEPLGLRIAFLGASTTYCAEAGSNESTWPHLVWKALHEQWPDVPIDYINAGVPGYRVSTSIRNLDHRVASLHPDVIVIYHAANDISFNSFKLARREGLAEQRTEHAFMWPAEYSLLWYLAEKNLRILNRKYNEDKAEGMLVFDVGELSAPFERDLLKLVEKSKEVARVVVLVTFSTHLRRDQETTAQAEAAATNLYYSPYMSIAGLLDSYEAYNSVIRKVAAETGVVLVGGEQIIPGDPTHFADSVHFTDRGSELMANRISQALFGSKEIRAILEENRLSATSEI